MTLPRSDHHDGEIVRYPKEQRNKEMQHDSAKSGGNFIRKLSYNKHIKHIHSLEDSFVDFCGSSSIHGVRYIGCRDSSYVEKLIWTVIFITTLYFAGTNILEAWVKWEKNPVKIVTSDKVTYSWEIPFPAVTICPQTKSKRSLYDIGRAYCETKGDPNKLDDHLKGLLQLCDAPCFYNINYTSPANPRIVRLMDEVAPTLEDICESITWDLDKLGCAGMFEKVLTEDGVCYSFNPISARELFRADRLHRHYNHSEASIAIQNWSPEEGYGSVDTDVEYPRRSFLDDKKIDLVINLRLNVSDYDYHCRAEQGFMVYVHSPEDFPQANYRAIYVPMGKSTYITVKPQVTEVSSKLLQFSPERRKCFTPEEKQLELFKVYTQKNCELECRAREQLFTEGCVNFALPHDDEDKICNVKKVHCTGDGSRGREKKILPRRNSDRKSCNCLQTCTYLKYVSEMLQTDLDYWSIRKDQRKSSNISYTQISVHYNKEKFPTFERTDSYTLTELLGTFGGLLGLFMGVSLLSFVEILYFCTLRPFCVWRRKNRKLQKQQQANARRAAEI
ncbi:pickpocket protein 28-like [Toxorhynchites rutilus septentrionalis]|uniref:pickpocket protein 28-like n=1 Tax=Toxorhynchites rutilus septentrionalis TaxID=329112 RepID=UPI002478F0B1|nr:pickpocket protein 28-like [Toxorhynchites rutilus septentrionalis]